MIVFWAEAQRIRRAIMIINIIKVMNGWLNEAL